MRVTDKIIADQRMLAKAGFYTYAIDGKWGKLSRLAMQNFCKANDFQWIRVDRNKTNGDVTLSRIYVDGVFICHGLEDEYRAVKKWGETRIPAGSYHMQLRTTGGFHNRYLRMFGNVFHRGMLHVLKVPNFTFILHHIGNYQKDTAGCLLLGKADYSAWAVWQSKTTYKRYYSLVVDKASEGKLWVTYEDND